MKLNTKTKYSCVGFASSAAALGLVAMAVICPGVDGAFAADETTHTENMTVGFNVLEPAEGSELFKGNLNVSFTVNPYIEISQNPGNVAITAEAPTTDGKTATGSTPFAVRTNSSSGFDVYVSATNKQLSPTDASNPAAINPIDANNTALSAFGKNTWGYAVTNSGTAATNYRTINDSGKAYSKSSFSASATNLQLNFGTKVDDTLPSDTYSTTVTVSAVLSGAEVTALSGDVPVAENSTVSADESGLDENVDTSEQEY